MPFVIVRNDITNMQVDAIVNTANPKPVVGAGVDAMIHEKAGKRLLLARLMVGDIPPGQAAVTPAYKLSARYVIHAVGPVWQGGGCGEEALLRACYDNSLKLAAERGCRSIAFPLMGAGNYGFPRDKALQIAIAAFSAFLPEHDMDITLTVFDKDSYRLSEKLFHQVTSYIDQHYVDNCRIQMSGTVDNRRRYETCRSMGNEVWEERTCSMPMPPCAPSMCSKSMSLEDMLRQADAGFTETLLKLIDESGKKDPEIYKKANISKQHFSKIRKDPNYRPSKPTAVAFAIALELDVAGTNDLIGRAGFTLSNSSKFDLIVRFFIEQRNFNIVEINMVLYEFDQALLGA